MKKASFVERMFNTAGYIFLAFTLLFFAVSYLRYDETLLTGIVSMAGFCFSYFFFTIGSLISQQILLRDSLRRKQLKALNRARTRAKARIRLERA